MDGMDKEQGNARIQNREYPCIWGYGNCPIRKQYKLKPESLAIFCGMCWIKEKKEVREFTFPPYTPIPKKKMEDVKKD